MKTIEESFLTFFLFIQAITILAQQDQQPLQSYSKYVFIPGEKLIFFDSELLEIRIIDLAGREMARRTITASTGWTNLNATGFSNGT
jgi:hypothetical protein